MGLSCSCGDFDKSDCERWWELGIRSSPDAGRKCCECDALLTPSDKFQCFIESEVFEPATERPEDPDYIADELTDEEYDQRRRALEDWEDDNGWDWETERCERVVAHQYRCERCEGLAEAIEDLGYCMIGPGELIENHYEYVEVSGGRDVIWKRDTDGVFHPRQPTWWDNFKQAVKTTRRRVSSFVRYGWKSSLRYNVWWPIRDRSMKAIGYRRGYNYEARCVTWIRD